MRKKKSRKKKASIKKYKMNINQKQQKIYNFSNFSNNINQLKIYYEKNNAKLTKK